MSNHIGDRHVLAAAVTVGAPHGIIAMTLDDFISKLLDDRESVIIDAISEMASRRQRPPASPAELLEILRHYIPDTIERLRQ